MAYKLITTIYHTGITSHNTRRTIHNTRTRGKIAYIAQSYQNQTHTNTAKSYIMHNSTWQAHYQGVNAPHKPHNMPPLSAQYGITIHHIYAKHGHNSETLVALHTAVKSIAHYTPPYTPKMIFNFKISIVGQSDMVKNDSSVK